MANLNFEKVNAFISGNSDDSYSSTGLRPNDNNENIVANSMDFKFDMENLEKGAEYRVTIWKNTKRKNEKSPKYNLQLSKVTKDADSGNDEGFDDEGDDFDF